MTISEPVWRSKDSIMTIAAGTSHEGRKTVHTARHAVTDSYKVWLLKVVLGSLQIN